MLFSCASEGLVPVEVEFIQQRIDPIFTTKGKERQIENKSVCIIGPNAVEMSVDGCEITFDLTIPVLPDTIIWLVYNNGIVDVVHVSGYQPYVTTYNPCNGTFFKVEAYINNRYSNSNEPICWSRYFFDSFSDLSSCNYNEYEIDVFIGDYGRNLACHGYIEVEDLPTALTYSGPYTWKVKFSGIINGTTRSFLEVNNNGNADFIYDSSTDKTFMYTYDSSAPFLGSLRVPEEVTFSGVAVDGGDNCYSIYGFTDELSPNHTACN